MNPTQTIVDSFQIKQSLAPQVIAAGATVNGSSVSLQGCEAALAVISLGAIVDAANKTVAVHLEKSKDDSEWSDIDTGCTTGAKLAAGQNKNYFIELNASELGEYFYVRAVAVGGSADGGLVAANIVKGTLRNLPPTQDTTPLYF